MADNCGEERKSCPKIEPTNNNMLDLTYEEKLSIVEKEAQSLYAFCMEKKLNNTEIYNCVSNLYGPQKSLTKRILNDSARTLFILSGIIGIISIVVMQPTIWTVTVVHAKLFAIKAVLPHWDWASLYEEDCMIANQWMPVKAINYTAEECKYCAPFEVERMKNVAPEFISRMVTEGVGEPLVVNDTMKDWGNIKKLTIEEIVQLYQNHELLSTSLGSCFFMNTAGFDGMFYDFFNAFAEKKLPNEWHATWINCDSKAAKVIRGYHPRPYFLPPMVQLGQDNSIIVANGSSEHAVSTGNDPGKFDRPKGKCVTVITGSLKFTLKPNEGCVKFGCVSNIFNLLPGETLFYVEEFWDSFYQTTDPGVTVAVSNNLMWDDVN